MEEPLLLKQIHSEQEVAEICLANQLQAATFRTLPPGKPWIVRALAYRVFELYAFRRETHKFLQHYLEISIQMRQHESKLSAHLTEPTYQLLQQTLKKARNFEPMADVLRTRPETDLFAMSFVRMLAARECRLSQRAAPKDLFQLDLAPSEDVQNLLLKVLSAKVYVYEQKKIQIKEVPLQKLQFVVQLIHSKDRYLLLEGAFSGRKSFPKREVERTFAKNCQDSAKRDRVQKDKAAELVQIEEGKKQQLKIQMPKKTRRYEIVGPAKVEEPKKKNLIYQLKPLDSESSVCTQPVSTHSESQPRNTREYKPVDDSRTEIDRKYLAKSRGIKAELEIISSKALKCDNSTTAIRSVEPPRADNSLSKRQAKEDSSVIVRARPSEASYAASHRAEPAAPVSKEGETTLQLVTKVRNPIPPLPRENRLADRRVEVERRVSQSPLSIEAVTPIKRKENEVKATESQPATGRGREQVHQALDKVSPPTTLASETRMTFESRPYPIRGQFSVQPSQSSPSPEQKKEPVQVYQRVSDHERITAQEHQTTLQESKPPQSRRSSGLASMLSKRYQPRGQTSTAPDNKTAVTSRVQTTVTNVAPSTTLPSSSGIAATSVSAASPSNSAIPPKIVGSTSPTSSYTSSLTTQNSLALPLTTSGATSTSAQQSLASKYQPTSRAAVSKPPQRAQPKQDKPFRLQQKIQIPRHAALRNQQVRPMPETTAAPSERPKNYNDPSSFRRMSLSSNQPKVSASVSTAIQQQKKETVDSSLNSSQMTLNSYHGSTGQGTTFSSLATRVSRGVVPAADSKRDWPSKVESGNMEKKECRVCQKKAIPFYKDVSICINCEAREKQKQRQKFKPNPKPQDWKSYLCADSKQPARAGAPQNEEEQQRQVQKSIKEIKERFEKVRPGDQSSFGSGQAAKSSELGRPGRETFDKLDRTTMGEPWREQQQTEERRGYQMPIRVQMNFRDSRENFDRSGEGRQLRMERSERTGSMDRSDRPAGAGDSMLRSRGEEKPWQRYDSKDSWKRQLNQKPERTDKFDKFQQQGKVIGKYDRSDSRFDKQDRAERTMGSHRPNNYQGRYNRTGNWQRENSGERERTPKLREPNPRYQSPRLQHREQSDGKKGSYFESYPARPKEEVYSAYEKSSRASSGKMDLSSRHRVQSIDHSRRNEYRQRLPSTQAKRYPREDFRQRSSRDEYLERSSKDDYRERSSRDEYRERSSREEPRWQDQHRPREQYSEEWDYKDGHRRRDSRDSWNSRLQSERSRQPQQRYNSGWKATTQVGSKVSLGGEEGRWREERGGRGESPSVYYQRGGQQEPKLLRMVSERAFRQEDGHMRYYENFLRARKDEQRRY